MDTPLHLYSIGLMTDLVLNRRQNHANITLTDEACKETVGYLRPDGGWRFVPWLGFIDRAAARDLDGALPVRLVNISRVGHGNSMTGQWKDVPEGTYVHGCLTVRGVYAVYETSVVLVGAPPQSNAE